MCGITAFLSKSETAKKYLLESLKILQNRGYDSAGICTLTDAGDLINTKFASLDKKSAINFLEETLEEHGENKIGIAHTRWATHGPKTDVNAHPHLDCNKRLALVHNGIIENYKALKTMLNKNGYTFKSETDTEVIANLISYYMDIFKGDVWKSINMAIGKLQGTWACAIIFKDDPNHLYVCKKGSPLLVAYNDKFTMIASEASAFQKYVNRYIVLRDNEIIKLGVEQNEEFLDCEYGEIIEENLNSTPDPYPHWMLKEIMEQPESILRAMSMGGRIRDELEVKLGGLNGQQDALLEIENLLILACGTSYHAGLMGAKFFNYLRCFNTVNVIDAAEFGLNDIPREKCGILVLSQSGETKDVHHAMEIAKDNNLFIIGIVNVVGSLIARESDCGIYLNAGREVAVASTKSFTSQVVVLALTALWFAQNRGVENIKMKRRNMIQDLYNLSMNFKEIIKNIDQNLAPVVNYLSQYSSNGGESLFILGRGNAYPIALEGALKIKEITYLHAEGYSGGALKHGPFSLIKKGTPIILLLMNDENLEKMRISIEEVKSRGATTIIITNLKKIEKNNGYDYIVQIPENNLSNILAILPLQYLAYKLAIEFGYNPDYPRNLAKCVSVA